MISEADASMVHIDDEQFHDLYACARERGCSPEEVVHLALENELAR